MYMSMSKEVVEKFKIRNKKCGLQIRKYVYRIKFHISAIQKYILFLSESLEKSN